MVRTSSIPRQGVLPHRFYRMGSARFRSRGGDPVLGLPYWRHPTTRLKVLVREWLLQDLGAVSCNSESAHLVTILTLRSCLSCLVSLGSKPRTLTKWNTTFSSQGECGIRGVRADRQLHLWDHLLHRKCLATGCLPKLHQGFRE